MRFTLSASPFRNIHKYHDDDILDYLESRLRQFAWEYHEQKKAAVPPCAYVFGATEGSFSFGYSFTTPGSFIEHLKYEARHLNAQRVVILTEMNSVAAPSEGALLVSEVQSKAGTTLRCAFDLLGPGRIAVSDDWTLPVDPDELDIIRRMDPVSQMIDESAKTSRLLGLELFFCPVFPNPSDSAGI